MNAGGGRVNTGSQPVPPRPSYRNVSPSRDLAGDMNVAPTGGVFRC